MQGMWWLRFQRSLKAQGRKSTKDRLEQNIGVLGLQRKLGGAEPGHSFPGFFWPGLRFLKSQLSCLILTHKVQLPEGWEQGMLESLNVGFS